MNLIIFAVIYINWVSNMLLVEINAYNIYNEFLSNSSFIYIYLRDTGSKFC